MVHFFQQFLPLSRASRDGSSLSPLPSFPDKYSQRGDRHGYRHSRSYYVHLLSSIPYCLGTIPDHASSIEVSSEVQSEDPEEGEHEQDDYDDYNDADDPDPRCLVASQMKSHAGTSDG